MRIGELVGSGRSADVYAIDGERVLRRYRDGGDAAREAAVMAHLAGHGYPVPEVFPGAGDGPGDLVMRRLSGPTMLRSLMDGTMTAEEAGALLARLLRELHAVPARVGARPGDRILHLDLHPDNVMLTARGPVVIDWRNTDEGPPGLDDAMSAIILAQVAASGTAGAGEVLAALLSELDDTKGLAGQLPAARARRGADAMLSPEEHALLDDAERLIRDLLG
ncbi:phosphotransferase [Nonomuraea sp. NN258]|uniref:phosphotransferase n=1 Tax=Nonomuraea antri TaxID=2730852 RepID=UPI0015686A23|nr:phosphotransferase [Nonomuraea antri]NRQ35758.1 phosphotransferase [Nonomuraea antri]